MSVITAYLTADVVIFVLTAIAGERIGSYAALAWRWYKRIKAVRSLLSGGERAKLSALEKALKAAPLSDQQKAALTPEELAVLTDPDATLPAGKEAT